MPINKALQHTISKFSDRQEIVNNIEPFITANLAQALNEAEGGRVHQAPPAHCTRQTQGGSRGGCHRLLDPGAPRGAHRIH